MAGSNEAARPGRLAGLDAIRGVAALSVLVYHALLVVPALDEVRSSGTESMDWKWVISHTPVRILWSGGAAVTLFFVLSGFVLTVAAQHTAGQRWLEYYVRRLLRLYLPVFGAVVLASFWITAIPRFTEADVSRWMTGRAHPTTVEVARDLMLFSQPGATTSVLWSLTWELAFSLLLPAYLWVVTRTARWAGLGVVAAIGLSVVGEGLESNAMQFLPMFAIGCYVAMMPAASRRLARLAWPCESSMRRSLTAVALAQLFTLSFLLSGLGLDGRLWAGAGSTSLLISCAAIVAIGAATPRLVEPRCRASLQWLGSRSFSIYLVHEPIVVSLAVLGAGVFSEWWILPLALPASLLVSEAFFRVVERPVVGFIRTITFEPAGPSAIRWVRQ